MEEVHLYMADSSIINFIDLNFLVQSLAHAAKSTSSLSLVWNLRNNNMLCRAVQCYYTWILCGIAKCDALMRLFLKVVHVSHRPRKSCTPTVFEHYGMLVKQHVTAQENVTHITTWNQSTWTRVRRLFDGQFGLVHIRFHSHDKSLTNQIIFSCIITGFVYIYKIFSFCVFSLMFIM